ncbi:putative leucine-rich repeat domain superfamily [Helianthus anomalus]
MERLTHVWKCDNWNKFSILHKQSSFHSLTTIYMSRCDKIKYLFSPLMAKLLSNLKTINIYNCHGLEEVVSQRDDKDEEMATSTTTSLFPHLHSLTLGSLKNLKRIGSGAKSKVCFLAVLLISKLSIRRCPPLVIYLSDNLNS